MTLKDRITEDMKTAMRAKDAPRLLTIRGLLAAMKQREVDERIVLDDAAVIGILDKLVKQRKDSIAQFGAGGRLLALALGGGLLVELAGAQVGQEAELFDGALEAAKSDVERLVFLDANGGHLALADFCEDDDYSPRPLPGQTAAMRAQAAALAHAHWKL